MAYVHHTVSLNTYTKAESPAVVRGIQRYHQSSNGWSDIGYNFLVDRFGQVFEGRAGGIDRAVIGAQAQGWNSVSTGIASVGTHTSTDVSPETFNAIASLLGWKLSIHGVPTQGTVSAALGGRRLQPLPQRPHGHASSASPATATAAPPAARATPCTTSCPRCAPAPAARASTPG